MYCMSVLLWFLGVRVRSVLRDVKLPAAACTAVRSRSGGTIAGLPLTVVASRGELTAPAAAAAAAAAAAVGDPSWPDMLAQPLPAGTDTSDQPLSRRECTAPLVLAMLASDATLADRAATATRLIAIGDIMLLSPSPSEEGQADRLSPVAGSTAPLGDLMADRLTLGSAAAAAAAAVLLFASS
jgi:hypothetical protein